MNYRVKNIDYWKEICPHRLSVIGGWMNDEVHTIEGEIEHEISQWGCFADITSDISMEQEREKQIEEQKKQAESAKVAEMEAELERLKAEKDEKKGEFVCPNCGKVCKSKAGLTAHMRKCNENSDNK